MKRSGKSELSRKISELNFEEGEVELVTEEHLVSDEDNEAEDNQSEVFLTPFKKRRMGHIQSIS
jgi:hypothetical protein